MALIVLVSAGGAPGVTTAAVALTLSWPGPALLAETDLDGGSVLAGFFAGQHPYDRGVLNLAMQLDELAGASPEQVQAAVRGQTLALDERGRRPVLPGPRDVFQAEALTPAVWQRLAGVLAGLPGDVLADAGRVRRGLYPLLAAAGLVVLVLRPTMRQAAAAWPRVQWLRGQFGERAPVGLCLIGDGPYPAGEIRNALGDFAVVVRLAADGKAAARLSDGAAYRNVERSALLSAARPAARALYAQLERTGGSRLTSSMTGSQPSTESQVNAGRASRGGSDGSAGAGVRTGWRNGQGAGAS